MWKSLPFKLVFLGVAFVLVAVLAGHGAELIGGNGTIVGSAVAQLLLLLIVLDARILKLPAVEWRGSLRWGILMGLGAVVLGLGVQWLWQALLSLGGVEIVEQRAVSVLRVVDGVNLGSLVVMAGLVGPVIEEVYFRYWWFDWLGRKLSLLESAIWTSLAFALFHGAPMMIPGIFVVGLLCAWARVRWGLGSAVACHIVFNLFTILGSVWGGG